jgi:tetratricopeptide (TPR) repeat protein
MTTMTTTTGGRARRTAIRAAALVGLLIAARVAVAAPEPGPSVGSPTRKELANLRYDQGKAYYRAGAFDLAITEFLAGYEIDPRSGVLFNVARAYEELKNRPQAIAFFKRYVDTAGASAPAAAEARARTVVLERQVKEEQARQQTEAAAERERQRQREQAAAALATASTAPAVSAVPPADAGQTSSAGDSGLTAQVPATSPASPTRARDLKLGGLVAGAAGVLATGVGVFFAVRGNSLNDQIRSEIDRTQSWSPELSSKDADMRSANKLAAAAFISAGVIVAGGAVLYALGWRESNRLNGAGGGASVALSPGVGPGGWTSVALVGAY